MTDSNEPNVYTGMGVVLKGTQIIGSLGDVSSRALSAQVIRVSCKQGRPRSGGGNPNAYAVAVL